MSDAIFRLIGAGALPVLLSAFFYSLEKKEGWRRKPYLFKQGLIGVCFGILAILSTEFGIPFDGAVMNVRNAAPVAAGLIFGGRAGIIAGLIGGIERWFAALWGVGEFTRLACTIATIMAGFFGAGLRVWMLEDKKPGWLHGLAIGITSEVLHMLLVFVTNPDDIQRAFDVVQHVALPMIAANGLSVMCAVGVVNLMSGKRRRQKRSKEKISQTFQRWLLLCVVGAFVVTMLFTGRFQTQLAEANADYMLRQNIEDVERDILEASDKTLLRITEEIAEELTGSYDMVTLRKLANAHHVTEINVVNAMGIIMGSTYAPNVGYDMASGEQSAVFLSLLRGDRSYVQSYQPISKDASISRKYAAVATDFGFVQVGYDASRFQSEINEQVLYAAHNRHVGSTGFILICNKDGVIISDHQNRDGKDQINIEYDRNGDLAPDKRFEATLDGEPSVCMYVEAEGYYILAVLPEDEAMFSRDVAVYILAFMEVIVFGALFAHIYFLIKSLIVNNIQKINRSLSQITGGNLDVTVNVRSNEEFASLSDDINTTVGALRQLIDEAAKRIDQELEFARQIQLSALPSVFPPYPNRTEMDLFACMYAAKEVGGDFYDFYFIDDNTLAMTIADVSGKGIPAAMFMMRAKTLLKSSAETGMPLAEAFTQTNLKLFENNKTRMFVTAWMTCVDLKTGRAVITNAGHNPPLIRRRGEAYSYFKAARGLILAASKRTRYQQAELQLEPGDELFLYTDGVTEATNAANELYGEERLLNLLNSLGELPMEELCARVKADVDAFVGDAPQFDDITMLGFRYKGGAHDEGTDAEGNA